jgi:hypothetical protein
VPTLIQEAGDDAKPSRRSARSWRAARPEPLSADEVAEIRAIGDNSDCMALKGASPEHEGDVQPDRWPLDDHLVGVAERWDIHPGEQLVQTH